MAKLKKGDDPHGERRVELSPFAGPIQFGAFHDECGAKANVWTSNQPAPVILIIVNIGICSLDVLVNGVPARQIPSRARRPDVIVAPAATTIDINCVLNVKGGDCDYFLFLIPL
jgi:hypothetical protein